jgi:hypothetical protein
LLFDLKDGFTLLTAFIEGVVAAAGADPMRALGCAATWARVE